MLRTFLYWLLTLIVVNVQAATAQTETLQAQTKKTETVTQGSITAASEFYYVADTGQDYRSPVSDRNLWQSKPFPGLPKNYDRLWLQVDFDFSEPRSSAHSLFIAGLGSYHIYWDGHYIGSNGKPGTSKDEEIAGRVEHNANIPVWLLAAGRHTLSLQLSRYYTAEERGSRMFWAFLTPQHHMHQRTIDYAFLPLLICGALILLAGYCLLHYFSLEKDSTFIIFSFLCLTITLLYLAESYRSLWGYPYHWHLFRLKFILLLSALVAFLLVLYLLHYFAFCRKHKRFVLLGVLFLQLIILYNFAGYDTTSFRLFMGGQLIAVLLTLLAIRNRHPHALLMLLALLVFIAPVAINRHFYMEQYFFVAFAALVLLMLYFLSRSVRGRQQALIQSQLTASRLQLELVKRNIQPHFILNTLTAVSEWIEESPGQAIAFVEALAEEFRNISRLSEQTLISLSDEISLCNSHLQVMNYRQQSRCVLSCEVHHEAIQVPPGVVLTLLENALSHNVYIAKEVPFSLYQNIENDTVTLCLSSPISDRRSKKVLNTGLGNQYLRARLQESFKDSWSFNEHRQGDCWQSTLTFPKRSES